MKQQLHATAVTHLRPVQQSRIFMWKFVPNAIRSIPGQQKAAAARGRIEKFNKKYGM